MQCNTNIAQHGTSIVQCHTDIAQCSINSMCATSTDREQGAGPPASSVPPCVSGPCSGTGWQGLPVSSGPVHGQLRRPSWGGVEGADEWEGQRGGRGGGIGGQGV